MLSLKSLSGRSLGKLKNFQKVGLAAILFACLVTVGLSQVAVAAEKGPIKIGFTAVLTGNFDLGEGTRNRDRCGSPHKTIGHVDQGNVQISTEQRLFHSLLGVEKRGNGL